MKVLRTVYLIIRNKVSTETNGQTSAEISGQTKSVATGDRSNVLAVVGAMLTSVAVGVFFFRKKRD